MRESLIIVGFLALIGFAAPRQAAAEPISFDLVGVNQPGLGATVVMTYDPLLALLSLDITNTSALYDPRITSFGLNTPTSVTGISSFSSSPSGWTYAFGQNGIDTPGQFGLYDAAGLTGPNFNGGSPNLGIAIGNTVHFGFVFTGSNLSALTEASFFNLLSYDPAGNPVESRQSFIARFQRVGPEGEGSDVATPVPEPTTLVLTGLGLLGLAVKRRSRRA